MTKSEDNYYIETCKRHNTEIHRKKLELIELCEKCKEEKIKYY